MNKIKRKIAVIVWIPFLLGFFDNIHQAFMLPHDILLKIYIEYDLLEIHLFTCINRYLNYVSSCHWEEICFPWEHENQPGYLENHPDQKKWIELM